MPIPETPRPDIILTFRGMLVLSFGRTGFCDVGFLLNPPPQHFLSVDVTRSTKNGAPELIQQIDGPHIAKQFSLNVTGPHAGLSQFLQAGFHRPSDQGDPNDFQWTVDFNNLFNAIQVDKDAFLSVFSLNDGEFFTERKSEDVLQTGVGVNPSFQDFGRTAVRVAARIVLQQGGEAVFNHGGSEVFKAEFGTDLTYGIDMSLSRFGPHPMPARDADAYYTAVGVNISESEKIHFRSVDHMSHEHDTRLSSRFIFIDPEAVCFPAILSQTPIT
jgi:hypothetical protein